MYYFFPLQYYLRQNVVHQIAIVPKYVSQRCIFKDTVDGLEVPSADIFLYNKCVASGGRRGLACISMTLVDGHGSAIHSSSKKSGIKGSGNLRSFIDLHQVNEDSEALTEEDLILQFRIWEQGRVDMEELVDKLQNIVQHSLWEVVTEYVLLPQDIISNSEEESQENEPSERLNEEFSNFAVEWFDIGHELKVVSLSKTSVNFVSHHSTLNSMKEVQKNLNINDLKVKTFQKGTSTPSNTTLYLPCNRHGLVPSVAESDTSQIQLEEVYLLLGRNFKHWKACLEYSANASNANELAPKEIRPLQRFQPLVVNSEPNSRADTPKFSPTESEEKCQNEGLFIPRQRLLLAFVQRNWIQLYAYNCSRDVNDKLNKQISNLGHWFAARSALSMSLVAQKCGLFHHQPFSRGAEKKKKANPYLNEAYLEPLVKHFSPQQPVEKAAYEGQIGKTYFDRKPSTPLQRQPYSIGKTSKDPFSFLVVFPT